MPVTTRPRNPARLTRCRHCRAAMPPSARRICWACRRDPALAAAYPSDARFARRGVGIGGSGRPPRDATSALPGTAAKMAVLAGRAARGEALFAAGDAGYEVGAEVAGRIKATAGAMGRQYARGGGRVPGAAGVVADDAGGV